jgi:separase
MRDEETTRPKSLSEAVMLGRDACNLRYLNGAATVVYGIPVYLGN